MEGLWILLIVLGAATLFGLWRQRTDGRMRHVDHPDLHLPASANASSPGAQTGAGTPSGDLTSDVDVPEEALVAEDVSEPLVVEGHQVEVVDHDLVPATHRLRADEIGVPLGDRATLVQFSSAFCAPCRTTRVVLGEVAGMVPGVAHVDIDAEANLDLVRRLDITRTPTVLVLDPAGRIRKRATGAPRRADVIAAIGALDPS